MGSSVLLRRAEVRGVDLGVVVFGVACCDLLIGAALPFPNKLGNSDRPRFELAVAEPGCLPTTCRIDFPSLSWRTPTALRTAGPVVCEA